MEKLTDKKWFNGLLALFFALLLFFNANSEGRTPKETNDVSLSATSENVPIKLEYDESKYFVSGYEEKTTVYLKSPNKVLLDIESNPQTRNFRVIANLKRYKEGTYEIPLKVDRLNSGVEATLKEKVIHVTIEKRVTKEFEIEPRINDSLLKKGYNLENITVDPPRVEVTSGEKTIKSIEQVVAPIDDDRDLMENFAKRVDVIALDKTGNVASVIMVPSTVTVNVKIEAPSKSVPVRVKQSGSVPSGVKRYNFDVLQESVKISGPRDALNKIDFLEVEVDTSIIQTAITNSYPLLLPENITVDPATVEVSIQPVFSEKVKPKESTKEKESQESTEEKTKETTTKSSESTTETTE